MQRQILALGGGGFSMEPENLMLDSFLISLSASRRPKICFVGTASGDSEEYKNRFYEAMRQHDVEASHLSLFKPPVESLEQYVLAKDILYVGGGNTRNLMVLWKEWGLDAILHKAYQSGIVMAGISAGSLCWFEEGVTDSITGKLSKVNCLGFLAGSNCPHYDGEPERRPAYQQLIANGMKAGTACDDGVAAYFVNERLVELVSSRPSAMGYMVEDHSGKVVETPVRPRYLGRC